MTKSFFFIVVGLLFSIVSILHFLRLMFEYQVLIGDWVMPGWISGLIVIFGIFMAYWAINLKKGKKEDESLFEDQTEEE